MVDVERSLPVFFLIHARSLVITAASPGGRPPAGGPVAVLGAQPGEAHAGLEQL